MFIKKTSLEVILTIWRKIMNSINTNMGALTAQKNMHAQNNELSQAMTRLSSGLRINSAADDAAGSAIASKMEAQVRSLDVAIRNSYDAISMTQTAEGALGEMENILQRVRELSVQASNSTLSDNDRTQIQAEVDTLIAEVDNIASKTHFNNVKLLDGSNSSVTFQIGINESDALNVALDKSDSTALGLAGSKGVAKLTSERVEKLSYTTNTILAADVKINGFNALSSTFNSDLSSATVNTAKSYADAINANTGVHGAEADAFNSLSSKAVGTFAMDGDISINSSTVANAASYTDLVSKINEAVSGVVATLNSDNSITLTNTDGDDIIIANGSSGTAASVGFTVGTYTGFVSLQNLDGSQATIEAGSATNGYTNGTGFIADVASFGFNEFSKPGVLETNTVSGTAVAANEIKINDVLIDESVSGSAAHVAAAINAKTAEHGVTANAENKVVLDLDFEARPSSATAFKVNGTGVDLRSANNIADFVTSFNSAVIGDLRASANSNGTVDLTSASGVDIVVSNTDNDFVIGATDIHGTAINTGLGNGTFDHDGIVAAHTNSAAATLDLTGGTLYNQVINGQIAITQQTTQDYSGVTFTITGKDASGNTVTEAITGANSTVDDDVVRGSTTFHTVTKIAASAAMTYAYDIGVHSTKSDEFDVNGLLAAASITQAGDITLDGALKDSNLNNSIITFTNSTDKSGGAVTYTVTGTDAFGATITETISYNSANTQGTPEVTIHGTQAFHTVTNIHADAVSTSAVEIGTMQVGDVVSAKGIMELTTEKGNPIKVEAVAEDHTTLNTSGGDTDTIMKKLGIQAQGQAFEVAGTGVDVASLSGASASLALIDKAIDKLSLFRSSFGAVENRIDASINNLTTLKVNTQAAQSRIEDADFAAETSKMTKAQILSQAATSMLAQANASKQNLLALLQG